MNGEITELTGSLGVTNDVHVGGDTTLQGDAMMEKNLTVKGWLKAPNLIGLEKFIYDYIGVKGEWYETNDGKHKYYVLGAKLGDDLRRRLEDLESSIGDITGDGGGTTVVVIGYEDNTTTPSDKNVLSSLNVLKRLASLDDKFLRKDREDTASELITFAKGLLLGDYVPGASGGKFDNDGNLEAHSLLVRTLANIATAIVGQIGSAKFVDGFFGEGFQIWKMLATNDWSLTIDRLTVRKLMTVYELLIQKIRAVGGQLVISAGNGKIKDVSVDETDENYLITFEDENTFVEGDLMRCQSWKGASSETPLKYYWVRVSASDGDTISVPVSEFEGVRPEKGDECVLMGNTDNPLRQNLVNISATEDGQPRVDVLDGIHEKNFEGCLRARLGNLDGITDMTFPADNHLTSSMRHPN